MSCINRIFIFNIKTTSTNIKNVIHEIVDSINASLLLSHSLRNDTLLIIKFDDEVALKVDGRFLKGYRPDLQSAKGLILKAIVKGRVKGLWLVKERDIKPLEYNEEYYHIIVDKTGKPLKNEKPPGKTIVHLNYNVEVKKSIKVSLTPNIYTIPQKIIIINNWLDGGVVSWS